MKEKNFNIIFAISSVATAFIIYCLFFAGVLPNAENPSFRAFLTGAVLAVAAAVTFAVIKLISSLMSGFKANGKVHTPSLIGEKGAIILLLIFLLGFVGQIIYSLGLTQPAAKKKSKSKNRYDIEILVDCSDSMQQNGKNPLKLCENIIDTVPEGNQIGMVLFTSQIEKDFSLSNVTAKSKKKYKSTLSKFKSKGGTSLTRAFSCAADTFEKDGNSDNKKMIIAITDGASPIHPDVKDRITDLEINVYNLKASNETPLFYDELDEFVNESGGFVTVASGNNEIPKKLIDEYEGIVTKDGAKKKLTFTNKNILFDESESETGDAIEICIRLIARFIFFLLLYILVSYYYFRLIGSSTILSGVITAVLTSLAVLITSFINIPVITAIFIALTINAIFSEIEVKEYV